MNHITPQPPPGPHGTSLSVAEAAAALHLPSEEVLRHIRAGDLPHLRLQGQDGIEFRVLPEDVSALRDRLAPEAEPVADQHVGNGHAGRPESRAETHPLTAEVLSETLAAALAPLLAQQRQLQSETARLGELVRVQEERIAELEAATEEGKARPSVEEGKAPPSPEEGERPPIPDVPPDDMQELGSQVRALREELALLRERRQQVDDGAFQQAWRRVQRRPWWADLLD